MSSVKFLRLEDFLDDQHGGRAIHLEPQGILFAEVNFNKFLPSTVQLLDIFICLKEKSFEIKVTLESQS